MNPMSAEKSWLLPPLLFALGIVTIVAIWAGLETESMIRLFDCDGASPVELMTLPLFALIVPLVWLCPPCGGSTSRQVRWASVWSLLSLLAIVRETDLHEALFVRLWPAVAQGFHGTVFKMRFLKAPEIPLAPKLFVLGFFALLILAVIVPLLRYLLPLLKGFFRRQPVAWATACFGLATVMVLLADRLPSNLKHAGCALSRPTIALLRGLEEGGEMLMALFALLALLMAHLEYGRKVSKAGEA